MSTEVDVLVVGAGPTGLTVALELQRRGVKIRTVERRREPSDKSKALVVHARTLELLDLVQVADELVSKGYTSPGIDFSSSADRPLRANMHRLASETRFPFILICRKQILRPRWSDVCKRKAELSSESSSSRHLAKQHQE